MPGQRLALLLLVVSFGSLPLAADVVTLPPFYAPFLIYQPQQPTTVVGINNNGVVLVSAAPGGIGHPEAVPGPTVMFYNGQTQTYCWAGGCYPTPYAVQGPLPIYDNPYASSDAVGTPAAFNDSGVVVGNYLDIFSDYNSFAEYGSAGDTTLDPPGYLQDLGLYSSTFNGINDSGTIIGNYSDYLAGTSGGFVYQNGAFTNLGFSALAINDKGQIVGEAANGDIIVDTNGSIRDLGQFPFTPDGVNDSLTIVGGDYLYQGGVFSQVQIPGAQSVSIAGINNAGVIVGNYGGSQGSFGFIVTPEPGYRVLLLIGFLAAAFTLRRRDSRV